MDRHPRRGRARFTLRDRVLPHGLPVALALVGINTAVGGTYGDYALATLLAEGGAYFSGILALAYASARVEWDDGAGHHARYWRRPGREYTLDATGPGTRAGHAGRHAGVPAWCPAGVRQPTLGNPATSFTRTGKGGAPASA
jgi:hypothetical protein